MLFWASVLPYLFLQVYAPIRCRGRWRVAALFPLAWVVPVVVMTAQWFREGGNLWPCLLMPAGLGTTIYLGVLIGLHSSAAAAARERDRPGFDVLPPGTAPPS